ncbi:hypothetical protein B0H17DRAFT_1173498 [Mycena rosella]|uniref:Uncharacterized protein n=1 Tax=Mycena rosella TaxID=1033263 RepID=A0AAD7H2I4_MYCRO|nr:hypothetical protein B0H17DRAFT_1173498 [Mycena rosella]
MFAPSRIVPAPHNLRFRAFIESSQIAKSRLRRGSVKELGTGQWMRRILLGARFKEKQQCVLKHLECNILQEYCGQKQSDRESASARMRNHGNLMAGGRGQNRRLMQGPVCVVVPSSGTGYGKSPKDNVKLESKGKRMEMKPDGGKATTFAYERGGSH